MARRRVPGENKARRKSPRRPPAAATPKAADSTNHASSLPSGVFKACNPAVEAELACSVANVFLRHMSAEDAPRTTDAPPPLTDTTNEVSPQEVDAFVTDLKSRPDAQHPQLDADLCSERLWILSDLSSNGSGLSRQRATTELRNVIRSLNGIDAVDPRILSELVSVIRDARQRGGISVLMQVLLLAATDALHHHAERAERAR